MTLAYKQPGQSSWQELSKILEERPSTLHDSFVKAVNAIALSREEGYISDDEADILLKWAACQYIAPSIDRVSASIMDWVPFASRRLYHERRTTRGPVYAR